MILPEIINPDGRPGPSECRVYTAQGGLLRTNLPLPWPRLGPYRANKGAKMSDPIARARILGTTVWDFRLISMPIKLRYTANRCASPQIAFVR